MVYNLFDKFRKECGDKNNFVRSNSERKKRFDYFCDVMLDVPQIYCFSAYWNSF